MTVLTQGTLTRDYSGSDAASALRAVALPGSPVEVRRAAITSLGRIQSAAAIDVLVDALHDENTTVRRVAAIALGRIGQPAAVAALGEALLADPSISDEVALALAAIANDVSLGALLTTVTDDSASVSARAAAAMALGHVKTAGTALDDVDPFYLDEEGRVHLLI
jgi:HEAT repeat protein